MVRTGSCDDDSLLRRESTRLAFKSGAANRDRLFFRFGNFARGREPLEKAAAAKIGRPTM